MCSHLAACYLGSARLPSYTAWPLVWHGNASTRPGFAELCAYARAKRHPLVLPPASSLPTSSHVALGPRKFSKTCFFYVAAMLISRTVPATSACERTPHLSPAWGKKTTVFFFLLGLFVPRMQKTRYPRSGVSASSPFRLTEGPAAGVHFPIVFSLAYVL